MKKLICMFSLAASLFPASQALFAQSAPVKQWDKTFGGCGTDNFSCMQQTADGGYIFGGTSISNITGDKSEDIRGINDYWIVKTDANGNKLWDKTFGGNAVDDLKAIEQTPDGGFVLAGWSYSEKGGEKSQGAKIFEFADYWVLKLDANGNKVWDKTIGGNYNDYLRTMTLTSDGGIILGGLSNSNTGFDKTQWNRSDDVWLVKLDSNGNILWDKTIGTAGNDDLMSIQETSDGGFILGARNYNWGTGNSQGSYGGWDYWVIKVNSSGTEIWSKNFGGSADDMVTSVRQTSDGGYMVGGYSSSGKNKCKSQDSNGGVDYWVLKLNSAGIKEWDKVFGGSGSDFLYSIQETFDGGYTLGGKSTSGISNTKSEPSKGGSDYWIIKVDANGNKIWDKTLGDNLDDDLLTVKQTLDGSFILGGTSHGGFGTDRSHPGHGGEDYWIVKLVSPETPLNAKFDITCNEKTSNVRASILGIPPAKAGNLTWHLTYSVNGTVKTTSGTSASVELESKAEPGTVYSLKKIESGTFVKSLAEEITIQNLPAAPQIFGGSRCGTGSVTFIAKGAGKDGKYVFYTAPTGGELIEINSSGEFNTSNLFSSTTYYVAIANSTGCESPRIPVTAVLEDCSTPVFSNLITPNNDGNGDTFSPLKLASGKWAIKIFDSSGKRNFESDNYQKNWPAKQVSNGVYYFILTNSDTGKQYKGRLVVMQ